MTELATSNDIYSGLSEISLSALTYSRRNRITVTFQETNAKSKYFDEAMEIYKKSFEASARQPISVIRNRVSSGKEKLLVGIMDKKVVSFALL